MSESIKRVVISPNTQPVAPLEALDDRVHVLSIHPGAYDQPLIFLRGTWRLQAHPASEGYASEGADLQWRGLSIYIASGATLELIGVSLHARLEGTQARLPSPCEELGERAAGVVCFGTLTARGCSLSTSGGHALSALGLAQISLEDTRLHHSGRCGLYMDAGRGLQGARLTCHRSSFEWNGVDQVAHRAAPSSSEEHETDGVWLTGELEAHFTGCHFIHNGGDGVYAKGGHVTLEGCSFLGNEVNGAYAGERATLTARGCLWEQSGEAGAGVKGGALSVIEGQLLGGEGLGLFALEGASLRVEQCLLSDHKGGGLLIIEPRDDLVQLSSLDLRDNGQLGVVLERARGAQLIDLDVRGSAQAQVYAVGSVFSCDTITARGGQFGFVAEDSSSTIDRLHIRDAQDVGLLVKPLELTDQTEPNQVPEAPTSSHRIKALHLTQRGGVGLLASGELTLTLSDASLTGDEGEPPQELISLDQVREVALIRCGLRGGEVGLRSRGTNVSLSACQLVSARETALVLRERSTLHMVDCHLTDHEGAEGAESAESAEGMGAERGGLQRATDIPRSRAGAGLWALDAEVLMSRCRLTGHRGSQLVLLGASEGRCHDCVIEGGQDAGVLIAQGARLTLTHSAVIGQVGAGLWLEREAKLEAQAVEVKGQQSGGVFVRDESRATLISCVLQRQVKASVMCDSGSAVSLDECVLSHGQDAGLLIERSAGAIVRRSRFLECALVAVAVHPDASLQLESSELCGGELGVLCLDGSRGEVIGNWIYGQRRAALLVYKGSQVEVDDNVHLSREELISEQH